MSLQFGLGLGAAALRRRLLLGAVSDPHPLELEVKAGGRLPKAQETLPNPGPGGDEDGTTSGRHMLGSSCLLTGDMCALGSLCQQ